MAGMKIQLVCMVLLAFTSWSLCTDSEEEMKALEADLLTNVHTSKIRKASVPSWKMTLLNVCSLINNLNGQAEGAGESHEEELITRRKFPTTLDDFSLEAMLTILPDPKYLSQQGLSTLGGSQGYYNQGSQVPLPRTTVKENESVVMNTTLLIQEDVLDNGNDKNEKEEVIKRKIPYILKRQLYENKPRRPYILKRGSYYY